MDSYDKKMCEVLERRWIEDRETQKIIYNDGAMIEWWEWFDDNMVIIHWADEDTDREVYITIDDLKTIIKDFDK